MFYYYVLKKYLSQVYILYMYIISFIQIVGTQLYILCPMCKKIVKNALKPGKIHEKRKNGFQRLNLPKNVQ